MTERERLGLTIQSMLASQFASISRMWRSLACPIPGHYVHTLVPELPLMLSDLFLLRRYMNKTYEGKGFKMKNSEELGFCRRVSDSFCN